MNESSPNASEVLPDQGRGPEPLEDVAEAPPAAPGAPPAAPNELEGWREASMVAGDFSQDPPKERSATIYWLILAVLFVGASILRAFPFGDNQARHVIWEFISTTLALVVGSLSLVRFYSKKQETFLFIGTGFLGTGLLNGYHAVMTSTLIADPATGF